MSQMIVFEGDRIRFFPGLASSRIRRGSIAAALTAIVRRYLAAAISKLGWCR